ncbi:DUF2795 domain-containing protein [Actinoallomurus iriomotensis]|uniref:DUF2795 domain-containing protein n=1 Tax=Actinoallomurus iriomotensis TaxID=478107 RepID=A0A9W6RJG9_9ACTN|nr:DUF2795 domain-containing protein [Actinoallomurus iriomotensis]GLY75177.1 hypothetical protein Airi01_034440 [Actinoallomurus iriomotensis]
MGDKSDKHGARLDDQLRHETEGLVRGGGPTHAERGNDPEPVETDAGRDPTAASSSRTVGAPPGMSPEDVAARSEFAKVLAGARYPATPDQLSAHVADEGAPDVAVRALGDLPKRQYDGLPEVMDALGYGHETERF